MFPRLVSSAADTSFRFGNDVRLVKTPGNYWPYATTLFDYIRRTMPHNAPGSLSPNEVYAVVAFLLGIGIPFQPAIVQAQDGGSGSGQQAVVDYYLDVGASRNSEVCLGETRQYSAAVVQRSFVANCWSPAAAPRWC